MLLRLGFILILLGVALPAFAATQGGAIPVPLPLFPQNNWWNTDISTAPLDPNSANFIQFIGPAKTLHPDFGGDAGGGDVYGFPTIIVNGAQPKKSVAFFYSDQSDGVDHITDQSFPFYPVPDEAITLSGWVEGGQPGNVDQRSTADRHVLIVDGTNNTLYELYNVWFNGTAWEAGSGAFFDMNTNNRRPDTWTSADAAGLAILPGFVRYDEVAAPGEIGHAFRVTVRATNGYVYPASHVAGLTANALPMGARLRLKASTNISGFTADVQKIFRAFKKYGLIVADNGSDMYISGSYDTRWDNGVLNPAFGSLKASDFEVVQLGWAPPVSFVVTIPSAAGAGDVLNAAVTAYDANYNLAASYGGTVHFSSTDGAATLPADYTFNGADAGIHTFTGGLTLRTAGAQSVTTSDTVDATITNTRSVVVGPATPTGLTATATSATSVNLSWNAAAGATQYEIVRATTPGAWATIATIASTNYSDGSATAGATFVYKVRAIDSSSRLSSFSIPDAATTLFFTDDPLVAGVTLIRAVHLAELRDAVNLMRAAAGLAATAFSDPVLSSATPVRAIHLQELRAALAQARTTLGVPPITFTDPIVTAGVSTVRTVHIGELRGGVE